jgi:hypothetical protein
MTDLRARLDQHERERREPAPQPAWRSPILARLTERRFADPVVREKAEA